MQCPGGEELISLSMKCRDTGIPQSARNRDIIIQRTCSQHTTDRGLAGDAKKLTVGLESANFISNSQGLEFSPLTQETNTCALYTDVKLLHVVILSYTELLR